MRIPVVYELNGRRFCLLVQDGETISVGSGEGCSIRVEREGVKELELKALELKAQFVNNCQLVVVTPVNGGVPYAQPLPWKLKLEGVTLELCRPGPGTKETAGGAGREVVLQGLGGGETRVMMQAGEPLLVGAGDECGVLISDEGCPEVLLALWTAGRKVLVQVVDPRYVVGWLGRAGEMEAELELPLSLSIGGRVILISAGDASVSKTQGPMAKPTVPALAPLPKVPGIQAKNADYAPKIVSRQAKAQEAPEDEGTKPAGKPVVQAAMYGSSPVPLPRHPTAEDPALLKEPVISEEKPYSPTFFLLCSWLLVVLIFAVALLPGQGVLTAEQMKQLWYAAGGTLIVTLVLGLGVMLK
ncbi:hypothetical protein [Prosthecobacter sp.]|uniref:hypothetical protein n=1 Tax=Prosthecobacter sp. TaxID=1965333 RepID=UPI0037842F77